MASASSARSLPTPRIWFFCDTRFHLLFLLFLAYAFRFSFLSPCVFLLALPDALGFSTLRGFFFLSFFASPFFVAPII
jgi:hypothetical protein